jgi:mannose-6-phosphate isomerase-like protein (cupin superfamily)
MTVLVTAQDPSFVPPDEGKKYNVFADTITVKVPSEMTGGAYSISEDATPSGQGAPPHIHHRERETFIVLEGEFEFRCGDRKFKTTKGGIAVLPKDVPHAFKNTGNTTGKTLVILVPGGMEKVFQDLSAMAPGPPDIGKINAITMKYGVEFLRMV